MIGGSNFGMAVPFISNLDVRLVNRGVDAPDVRCIIVSYFCRGSCTVANCTGGCSVPFHDFGVFIGQDFANDDGLSCSFDALRDIGHPSDTRRCRRTALRAYLAYAARPGAWARRIRVHSFLG